MALQNPIDSTHAWSATQSAVYKLDVSEVLSAILLDDTDFLSFIGISGEVATETKHQWVEDALNAVTVKGNSGAFFLSAANSAQVVITLSASQAARVTAGTLLRDEISGKTEVLQVTARSGISATVTRGYGSTSPEAHAAGATWRIIAHARPQGMEGPKDESTARSFKYNFTEIFSKGVKITGTAQAIEQYGVGAEDQYQIDLRMRELKRELDHALLMGIRAPSDVAATVYGTMGGLLEFAGLLNTTNVNNTAETLVPSVLNAMAKQVFDAGGTPDFAVMGATQKQKFSLFDQEFRRSTMDTRRAGFTNEEFVTDLGVNLRVIVDRWMPVDVCVVGDSSRIKVLPLTGRAMFLEKLAKTGDAERWQIVGEYTAEFRNANETLAYHNKLKQ
jgi:hypothetical protein